MTFVVNSSRIPMRRLWPAKSPQHIHRPGTNEQQKNLLNLYRLSQVILFYPMDYKEQQTLKDSREYKAVEALTDSVNAMGWNPKRFAMAVAMQHRTLQQELMKTFVATIRTMASNDYGYDDRNRGSHEAAVKMVESGTLDEIYLPFI